MRAAPSRGRRRESWATKSFATLISCGNLLGVTARTATRSRSATPSTGAARTDVTEVASQLRVAVARPSRRIRQQTGGTSDELTGTMQGVLAVIEGLGPISLGELAAVEQVQPPSMTRIVARLEDLG